MSNNHVHCQKEGPRPRMLAQHPVLGSHQPNQILPEAGHESNNSPSPPWFSLHAPLPRPGAQIDYL